MKSEIISRTCIKPSSPTPPDLRTFKLSLLDQLSPAIQGNMTFFFPSAVFDVAVADPDSEFARKSQLLQKSMSETLTRFYPLAGSLVDAATIDCNDDGGFFVEARCSSPLSDFLSKPNWETLDLLLPTMDPETMEFVSLTHKIADIAGLLTLLKSWTEACRGSTEPVVPDFIGASILAPREIPGMSGSLNIAGEKFIARRFMFSAPKIVELKEKVTSMIGREKYYPSRVEVVLALLWKSAVSVIKSKTGTFKPTALFQAEESDMEIHQLAEGMWKSKNEFLNNKANKFKGEGGERGEIFKNRKDLVMYKCSSWCKFPLFETDFGWGKPAWMTSVNKLVSNTISLMDTSSGGVEALVTLDEEEMTLFERHEELLEFASVNPSIVD
ncbi:hypothetical protein I3843_11G088900 [Carya illinoinensis]|uniref:BAHD acyltransferase n=1 Tax=Carya illinoinensis TaxID=32201 RepID=A0A922DNE1_CARIL|nr:hypothetical protein I3842_11G089400 [Carya illinoinensis]KAG7955768.1 hypothetical protein I3843_11G088900 [Carya illinoinensis]